MLGIFSLTNNDLEDIIISLIRIILWQEKIMASLQEQLLKAGLSSKQKARQANTDKRRKNKQQRSGVEVGTSMQDQVKNDLAKTQQQKADKDAALNAEKQQALAAKELQLRIKQILQHHQ
ncbi:DUF2058 domain-containing protein, partial [bacterium]|nr:DUF2058 domain-containing protein [bacterium]